MAALRIKEDPERDTFLARLHLHDTTVAVRVPVGRAHGGDVERAQLVAAAHRASEFIQLAHLLAVAHYVLAGVWKQRRGGGDG